MQAPPFLNSFYEFKEFAVDGDEVAHHLPRSFDLCHIPRTEDNGQSRFGRALHHVLALFVEAGGDDVMLIEGDKQRRQRRTVVVSALVEILSRS
jgi:hypothetical protein